MYTKQHYFASVFGRQCMMNQCMGTSVWCINVWTPVYDSSMYGHQCMMYQCMDISLWCINVWKQAYMQMYHICWFPHTDYPHHTGRLLDKLDLLSSFNTPTPTSRYLLHCPTLHHWLVNNYSLVNETGSERERERERMCVGDYFSKNYINEGAWICINIEPCNGTQFYWNTNDWHGHTFMCIYYHHAFERLWNLAQHIYYYM